LLLVWWSIASWGEAADCLPAPSGLVGWWPGDGSASDILGTNNGTLQGGVNASAAGVVGACFSFDGTNGYVQIPDAPELRPTNLTIEAWVRFNSLDTPGSGGARAGEQYVVFKQNSRSNFFEGYFLGKSRLSGRDIFVFGVSSPSGLTPEVDSTVTVTTNVWYHIAGVRGSNYIQLYVNGLLDGQTNVDFPQDYGNYPLFFGSSGQPYWDRKFSGLLDEVSLYNRALPPSDIAAIYAAGSSGKCKPPSIISQPQNQCGYWGGAITLSAAVGGPGPLSYQWLQNGLAVVQGTDSSLVLTNLQTTNAGSYTLVVSNLNGSATSRPAVVQVKVADVAIALLATNTQNLAALTIAGVANQTYGIQGSSNLTQAGGWVGLTNYVAAVPTNVWFDPAPATNTRTFYRVSQGPIAIP
jgi:hypothetical protein